jgi:hypothetical protein
MESLVGWEFRGYYASGTLPGLLVSKHRKGFYRLARSSALAGYNIPCHRGSPGEPWVDRLRGPGSRRLGWFLVVEGPSGVVLDYSRAGRASALSPLRLARERLVSAGADLLISTVEIRVGPHVRHAGLGVYERYGRGPLGV